MNKKILLTIIAFATTIVPLTNIHAMQEKQNFNNISETKIKEEKIVKNEESNQNKFKNVENKDARNKIKDSSMSSDSEESLNKSINNKSKENENNKNTDLNVNKNQKETKKYNLNVSEEDIKNVDAELEEAEERIDEITDKMDNLDIEEIKKVIEILESHRKKLKKFKKNNKEAEMLYYKTVDLQILLDSIKDLKNIEQKTKNTKKLLKNCKEKYELSQEIKEKIAKANKSFKKTIEKVTKNIKDEYNYHIEDEGKENVFFVENLKTMVKKLEVSLKQYEKTNKDLNLVEEKINNNKIKLKEIEEKIKDINEISNEKIWGKYDITELKNTIKKLNNIEKLLEEIKNEKADEIYFKVSDFKIVLKSRMAYLKGMKLSFDAENLKDSIINNLKENIVEKDINNKIIKLNTKISKSKKKISKIKEELEETLKIDDRDFVFFKTEITYKLSELNFLHSRLIEIEKELNKAPEIAIEQIILNVKNEAEYLKNERKRLEKLYDEDENYVEDEKTKAEERFIEKINEFEKLYKQSHENLNYINKKSVENLEKIYKEVDIESLKMAL